MTKIKAKTIETSKSVSAFLKSIPDPVKRAGCIRVAAIMQEISGFEPKMWGPAIVGFGSYHYKYESGHEGDAPLIGFSPRKAAIVLYLPSNFTGREALLKSFGKHTSSKACIYVKKLEDISIPVLRKMVTNALKTKKENLKC